MLRQTGSQQWAVTILLADTRPACKGSAGYWLETTPPNTATASPGSPSPDGVPTVTSTASPGSPSLAGKPAVTSTGSSCQVTVTFTGLQGIPTTAALVLDQSGTLSVISLTVSRNVSLCLYLWIPLITGFVLALVTFFWALRRVRASFGLRADGGTRRLFDPDMLYRHPIVASGAWTLGDSWATNISTGIVVIGAVFGVTTATSTLFPGVALDRFALVNIAAGIIVSFAPLIFGIFYARYIANNPGPSADATVMPPMTVSLSALTEPAVLEGTMVRWRHGVRTLRPRQLTQKDLANSPLMGMPRGGSVRLASKTLATLPAGATVTLRYPDGIVLRHPTKVQLPQGAVGVQLPENVTLAPTGLEAGMMLLPTGAPDCELPLDTVVTLPNGRAEVLAGSRRADVPAGALVRLPESADVTLSTGAGIAPVEEPAVTLKEGRSRSLLLPLEIAVRRGVPLRLGLRELTRPEDPDGQVVKIMVVSGAAITVLAGATITWQPDKNDEKWTSAAVQAGKTIQVSAGSQVRVPAGVAIALPGGSDIPVPAQSAISLGGDQGTLAVAGGDLVPPPKAGNSSSSSSSSSSAAAAAAQAPLQDLMVSSPACISLPGGAKITVTGSADIGVPAGTVITPPHYRQATVPTARELQVPQPTSVITGNLWMTLVAAFVTMLGIGAEFGIAGVLAFGLSEASQAWRDVMLAIIVVAGFGVLRYAVTAIAALADPQPGSSLSSRSGTSFTL